MRFPAATLYAVLAGAGASMLVTPIESFSPAATFVGRSTATVTSKRGPCGAACNCPACTGKVAITCDPWSSCVRQESTRLFAEDDSEAEVPAEVEAMDGVESADEAHNADRPARESIKKKRAPKGKPLSEFEVGTTLSATVKSLTTYGAFCDFGASSDGLLHISRMSKEFVDDVKSVVSEGDEVEVRIVEINAAKNQVALSLLSEADEQEAADAQAQQRKERADRKGRQNSRRDDMAVLSKLETVGFDSDQFVAGKVVSVVAFGAFVRVNAADINGDVEGSFDGLVHISALQAGRTNSVTDIVNVDDDVQVRVKGIGEGKVSLSMVSAADEAAAAAERAAAFGESAEPEPEGSDNWKEEMVSLQSEVPSFMNGPIVVDMRN